MPLFLCFDSYLVLSCLFSLMHLYILYICVCVFSVDRVAVWVTAFRTLPPNAVAESNWKRRCGSRRAEECRDVQRLLVTSFPAIFFVSACAYQQFDKLKAAKGAKASEVSPSVTFQIYSFFNAVQLGF